MRRTTLIILLCFGFLASHAQNKAVNKASNLHKAGKLDEAKEQIDMAIEHEKTRDNSKTWYTRGLIYASIDTSKNEAYNSLDSDAFNKSIAAFKKAMELEGKKDSPLHFQAESGLDNLWQVKLNEGVSNYESKDYDRALKNFEKAVKVKPQDTLAMFYAGIAAQNKGDLDEAISYFYKYEKLGNPDEQIYLMLVTYEISKENSEKALEIIDKAQKKYPKNTEFSKYRYEVLLKEGKTEDAVKGLEDAIKADPANPDLHYNIGALQEQLGNKEEALKAYKKALEIDPNYKNAAYNVAVIYYNRAADIIREANNLTISAADQKKHKELTAQASVKFKEALPHLEKAHSLLPEQRTLAQILVVAYDRTGQHKKADEMEKKLDSMPEE